MDEIDKLEAEIAEKKKLLSKLRKEKQKGERLEFKPLRKGLSSDSAIVGIREYAIDRTRHFVLMWARAEKEVINGRKRLIIDGKSNNIQGLSRGEIEACNDLIIELIPVLKKYVHILNEMEVENA